LIIYFTPHITFDSAYLPHKEKLDHEPKATTTPFFTPICMRTMLFLQYKYETVRIQGSCLVRICREKMERKRQGTHERVSQLAIIVLAIEVAVLMHFLSPICINKYDFSAVGSLMYHYLSRFFQTFNPPTLIQSESAYINRSLNSQIDRRKYVKNSG
jgi:hypothetical protein